MSWILLTIAAIACRAAYGIFSKTMSRDIDGSPYTHSVLLLFVGVPIGLLASPFLGGVSTSGLGENAFSVGLLVTAGSMGNILYFKGVRRLGAGVTQIAFSSVALWALILSIVFLDSRFSLIQIFGTILLLSAIWMAQYERSERADRNVLFVVAAACCFAIFLVISADVADSISVGTYVLLGYFAPGLLTFIIFRRSIRNDYRSLAGKRTAAIRSTLPASATSVAYYIFAFFAYREAPDPGVVIILLSTQVIVAVILAMIFLGERRHPKRTLAAGVLAVVAGMAIKA